MMIAAAVVKPAKTSCEQLRVPQPRQAEAMENKPHGASAWTNGGVSPGATFGSSLTASAPGGKHCHWPGGDLPDVPKML